MDKFFTVLSQRTVLLAHLEEAPELEAAKAGVDAYVRELRAFPRPPASLGRRWQSAWRAELRACRALRWLLFESRNIESGTVQVPRFKGRLGNLSLGVCVWWAGFTLRRACRKAVEKKARTLKPLLEPPVRLDSRIIGTNLYGFDRWWDELPAFADDVRQRASDWSEILTTTVGDDLLAGDALLVDLIVEEAAEIDSVLAEVPEPPQLLYVQTYYELMIASYRAFHHGVHLIRAIALAAPASVADPTVVTAMTACAGMSKRAAAFLRDSDKALAAGGRRLRADTRSRERAAQRQERGRRREIARQEAELAAVAARLRAEAQLGRSRHVSLATKLTVLLRDGPVCRICHRGLPIHEIEFDHVFPFSRGGSNDQDNIQVLRQPCNRRKGTN